MLVSQRCLYYRPEVVWHLATLRPHKLSIIEMCLSGGVSLYYYWPSWLGAIFWWMAEKQNHFWPMSPKLTNKATKNNSVTLHLFQSEKWREINYYWFLMPKSSPWTLVIISTASHLNSFYCLSKIRESNMTKRGAQKEPIWKFKCKKYNLFFLSVWVLKKNLFFFSGC